MLQGSSYLANLYIITITIVSVIGLTTIAIGWHRFVLLEETPNSFYVLHRKWPIGGYFLNTIKISLISLFIMIPLSLFVVFPLAKKMVGRPVFVNENLDFSHSFLLGIIIPIILGTFFTWLLLRISTILPALAVGKRMSLGESFQFTKPISGQLVIAAFCVAMLQRVPSFVQAALVSVVDPTSVISTSIELGVTIIFTFTSFFVGFGILTVVYGHLAEGKPI